MADPDGVPDDVLAEFEAELEGEAADWEAAVLKHVAEYEGRAHYDPNQPRDEQGRWTDTGAGGGGASFVSPNVANLDFDTAERLLRSPRQKALKRDFGKIDALLGLEGEARSALGAWSDGAENSTVTKYANADMETLRAAAAMKGYIANQKAVLVFKEGRDGDGILYEMKLPAQPDKALHKRFLESGLEFHTFVKEADGTRVVIFDGERSKDVARAIGKLKDETNAKVKAVRGTGEFIGADDRAEARREYERAIGASRRAGDRSVRAEWERLRDRWGKASETNEDVARDNWQHYAGFDPDQPRDEQGRWTSGGGSGGLAFQPDYPTGVRAPRGKSEIGPRIDYDALKGSTAEKIAQATEIAKTMIAPGVPDAERDAMAELMARDVVQGVEYAVVMDANGNVVGRVRGRENYVSLDEPSMNVTEGEVERFTGGKAKSWGEALAGSEYKATMLHNHPSGNTLSSQDIAYSMVMGGIDKVVAVAGDGSYYAFTPNFKFPEAEGVRSRIMEAATAAAKQLVVERGLNKLTEISPKDHHLAQHVGVSEGIAGIGKYEYHLSEEKAQFMKENAPVLERMFAAVNAERRAVSASGVMSIGMRPIKEVDLRYGRARVSELLAEIEE